MDPIDAMELQQTKIKSQCLLTAAADGMPNSSCGLSCSSFKTEIVNRAVGRITMPVLLYLLMIPLHGQEARQKQAVPGYPDVRQTNENLQTTPERLSYDR